MKIRDAVADVTKTLNKVGMPEARMEAEFLVASALGVPRTALLLKRDESVPQKLAAKVKTWTQRRAKREPLAYLTGEQPFGDVVLAVNRSVLIPRPETEELVERAKFLVRTCGIGWEIVDVGAGSGAIGLSLARETAVSRVLAIDISEAALQVARRNARRLDLAQKWFCQHGDLLAPAIGAGATFDLVIANLPYIRSVEMDQLQPEVRWEPKLALDGGPQGTVLLDRLAEQAALVLKPRGYMLLEVGWDQGIAMREKLRAAGWQEVQVHRDVAGIGRLVEARRGQ